MPGLIRCTQRYEKRESDTLIPRINLTGVLRSGVTISSVGTPVVIPTGLTVSGQAASGGALTIDGVSVDAGKAITFTAAGGTADEDAGLTEYEVAIPFTTSGGETRTVEGIIIIVKPDLTA